jgi:small subunit ribosomal protein S8
MLSDTIADMFTRIRNGLMVGKEAVDMPATKLKAAIADILKQEGYIEDFAVGEGPKPVLTVTLKYYGRRRQRRSVISGIERVSRPGRRVYVARSDIPWVKSGMGIAILSTPKGMMTGQRARREGIGGEVIGYIW